MKDWQQTWFIMADGDINQYNVIKGMEVKEFYTLYDTWRAKIEAIESANKKK